MEVIAIFVVKMVVVRDFVGRHGARILTVSFALARREKTDGHTSPRGSSIAQMFVCATLIQHGMGKFGHLRTFGTSVWITNNRGALHPIGNCGPKRSGKQNFEGRVVAHACHLAQ
jgi:hypothetical protein